MKVYCRNGVRSGLILLSHRGCLASSESGPSQSESIGFCLKSCLWMMVSPKAPYLPHPFSSICFTFFFYRYYFGFYSSKSTSAILISMTCFRPSGSRATGHFNKSSSLDVKRLYLSPGMQTSEIPSVFLFFKKSINFLLLKAEATSWTLLECPYTHNPLRCIVLLCSLPLSL